MRESGNFYFWKTDRDSRHVQLAISKVLHEESESAARIDQFLHLEERRKLEKRTNLRVSRFLIAKFIIIRLRRKQF